MDFGIFSLTADPVNILMWSYYSKNSGFIVQYDIKELKKIYCPSEIILGPFQINYQNKILPILFDTKNIILFFLYLTNIKSKRWQHENEWRMIFGRENMETPGIELQENLNRSTLNDRKFRLQPKTINKIILGKNFFDQREFSKNDEAVSINLQNSKKNKSFFLKKYVLDYIIQNNIPSELIGLDSKRFSLKTLKIKFQKTECDYQYTMTN
ncbi:MAG: DUF2971 domain-containing protein [Bacteroidetes bacterium]|nr:DUF2971 domain-containing protein [Bacteroidota bacterium]MBL7105425.1 DUF2971 domain-containing protein [Bacteroidales bacterium]